MKSNETARELLAKRELKERLEADLKAVQQELEKLEKFLIGGMLEEEVLEFRDELTGKRFRIEENYNVRQSDYARLHDAQFAEIFGKHGFEIFKYSCHAQTLGAAVRREIALPDESGELELPDWAAPFVELSKYRKIRISK